MVAELVTKVEKDNIHHVNSLTKEMDDHLIPKLKNSKYPMNTYVYDHPINKNWLIRYPGATRGRIVVDDDMIIRRIELYDDEYHTDDIYDRDVRSCFHKYIGMKLVVEKEKK